MKSTEQQPAHHRFQVSVNGPVHTAPVKMQEEVRRRVYEIYQEAGMAPGSDLEDWLQAEEEILQSRRIQRAA